MGSPLTLTIANCYMFFFERNIVQQISNSNGLYFRYIDDIFIIINWPTRHLLKEIDRWNQFDTNIQLSANVNSIINFLDLHVKNQKSSIVHHTVYHKPSYQPYYLPFTSVHRMHMKKNIPFAMFLRAIRYCSTFDAHLNEREKLRLALLLNKYPGELIDQQFNYVLQKFIIDQPITLYNYDTLRQIIIDTPIQEKVLTDHSRTMFVHFTYCSNMQSFPARFHTLWNKYFLEFPINEVVLVLGTRDVDNLQRRLIHTRQS
jgi:hypothetical protein